MSKSSIFTKAPNGLALASYLPPVNVDCVTNPVGVFPEPLATTTPRICSEISNDGNLYLSRFPKPTASPLNIIFSRFFSVGSIKTFLSHLTLYNPSHSSGISVPSTRRSAEPNIVNLPIPFGVFP